MSGSSTCRAFAEHRMFIVQAWRIIEDSAGHFTFDASMSRADF
jgi:hypothetical protein